MIDLDLGGEKVGSMLAVRATIRPRSVFALVTLGGNENNDHKLRLDLGKAVFIDHVSEDFSLQDMENLTNKILAQIQARHLPEYSVTPEPTSVSIDLDR